MPSSQPPSLGRVVLFHYRGFGRPPHSTQWITCPAVITRVLDGEVDPGDVNLHVLHDALEDVVFPNNKQEAVPYSDEEAFDGNRRWSWPPRV